MRHKYLNIVSCQKLSRRFESITTFDSFNQCVRYAGLEGVHPGTYPSVRVNPAFAHLIPDGTLIHVKLVTRFDDIHGRPQEHWHVLTGKVTSFDS